MSQPNPLPTSQGSTPSSGSQVQSAEDGDDAMPGKTAVFTASGVRKHGMAKCIHIAGVRCQFLCNVNIASFLKVYVAQNCMAKCIHVAGVRCQFVCNVNIASYVKLYIAQNCSNNVTICESCHLNYCSSVQRFLRRH